MLDTMYLSILNMAVPHKSPNRTVKTTAAGVSANTKYMAYPEDNDGNNAVKNIVAPMPTYLLCSRGYFFKVPICAPEQNQKKRVMLFINAIIYVQSFMKRYKETNVTNIRPKYLKDNNYL